MSGASAGTDPVTIMLGFLVFIAVLTELHGYSVGSAIFALPVIIFSSLLLFLSHLLGLLTRFFISGLSGGIFGLLLLGLALVWTRKSLVGFSPANFMLIAIFLVMVLLVI